MLGGCAKMFISDETFISDEFKQIMEQKPASMQEIWEIEDEYEFVSELSMHIAEKCDYGSNLDVLSDEEKVFYITQTLEMEVNNGGFWQFLYNVEEDVFSNTVSSFSEIGAEKTAALCQNAFSAFGTDLPGSREARIQFLSKIGIEECYEILSEYDALFYAYEEDLTHLNYIYVQNHADAFS
jgi:hypothetical protein